MTSVRQNDSSSEAPAKGGCDELSLPEPTVPFVIPSFPIIINGHRYITDPITTVARREGASPQETPEVVPPATPTELGMAAKLFQLLTALDPDSRLRKAPPIKVFLLRFRQGLEPAEIARRCHCNRSLVFARLKEIQQKLPWKPQQLRELS